MAASNKPPEKLIVSNWINTKNKSSFKSTNNVNVRAAIPPNDNKQVIILSEPEYLNANICLIYKNLEKQ